MAGIAGGTAPHSAVLLAQMRSRQAAVNAAASSAARNDPEVREMLQMSLYVVRLAHAQGGAFGGCSRALRRLIV